MLPVLARGSLLERHPEAVLRPAQLADPGARTCSPWAPLGGGPRHSTVTSAGCSQVHSFPEAIQPPPNLFNTLVSPTTAAKGTRSPGGPVLSSHCGLPSPPGPTSAGKGLWASGQLPQNCSGDVPRSVTWPVPPENSTQPLQCVKRISRSQGHRLRVGPVSSAP